MAFSKNSLHEALAKARQELQDIQAHVIRLEAQLAASSDQTAPQNEITQTHAAQPGHGLQMSQRLQKIIEHSHESVVLIDAQGQVIYTNYSIPDTSYAQAVPLLYPLHQDDETKVKTFFESLRASLPGTTQILEIRYRHPQGHIVWHEITAINRLDETDIGALVITSRDVTARKQAQQQAQCLFDLLKATHNATDFHAALSQVVAIMGESMGWDYGDLWIANAHSAQIVNGQASYLATSASPPLKEFYTHSLGCTFVPDEGLIGRVWSGQRVEWIVDLQQAAEQHFKRLKLGLTADLRGIAAVPIIVKQQTVAVLCFYSRDRLNNLDPLSQMLMTASEQASLAIERKQSAAMLEQHATQLEQSLQEIRRGEESLQHSEARYRRVVDDQTDLICRYDADLRLTFVNKAYASLYNTHPDDMNGRSILDLIPANDRPRAIAHVKALTVTHPVATSEHTSLMPDGTIRWMQWTDRALFDDQGQIVEYQGVGRDITQRKHNEEELARYRDHLAQVVDQRTAELSRAKSRVEAILHNSTEGILLAYPATGIEETNLTFNALFACHQDSYAGQSLDELVHSDDRTRFKALIEAVRQTQSGQHGEFRARRWDGSIFEAYIGIGYVHVADGDGLVCTIHDISAIKERERQLRYYASLQENVSDAVIATDLQFIIQSWNRAAERIYGWRADEAIGRSTFDILKTTYDAQENEQKALEAFLRDGSWRGETQQRRKDNTIIDVLGSVSLISDENSIPIGVVAVNRDITEQKRAESALRESEARYRLLADHITDVVASFDMNYTLTYISPSCKDALGYSPEEMIGHGVDEFIHPNDASIITMAMATVEEGRFMMPSITFRFHHKDGHYIWLESVGRIIISEKTGEFLGVISSSRNVTERKEAEETLGVKFEDERKFQKYLKELHEITIELTQIDQLDQFFKEVVQAGLNRLGFERFALFLYDAPNGLAIGTYGTSTEGQLVSEHHIRFDFLKTPGILARTLHRAELFSFEESTTLYTAHKPTGQGWSGCAALRNGTEVLGWIVVDNGLYHGPASKPQLEILGLYGIAIGSLLARKQLEVDLRESEERFRLLIEDAPQGIVVSHPDGYIVLVNAQTERLFGYTRAELIGQPTHILVPEAYRAGLLTQPSNRLFDAVAQRKDGSVFHAAMGLSVIIMRQEAVEIRFISDITQRKDAETAIRESEARYRLLAENVTDMITRSNRYGVLTYVSPSTEGLIGYTPQELLNKSVYTHIHPDDIPWMQLLSRAVIEQKGSLPALTYRLRHKDGHYLWLETDSRTIYGPDGKMDEFISSTRNVTQRKMAEEALRQSEERFRLLVEAAPLAIILSNQVGEITLVNNQAEKLFGYKHSELVTQPIEILIPVMARDKHSHHRSAYHTSPHRIMGAGMELFGQHKNGQQFPVEVELSSIETDDGWLVMSFVIDMTTHKAAEDALRQSLSREKELNELKSRFVSMASHEFRTPLASILAINETLSAYRSKMDDVQIEEKLRKMRDQIEHLNHIMEDVLQLARLQARRMEFNPRRINLDSLCRSVLDEFQSRSNSRHEWEYHCDDSLQDVQLDKKLMRQIISNLVSNAMKYSPAGKLIRVMLTREDTTLVIRVQDQGIGIPEADLAHLFEPFHRATNVETISGTGLGLTIVKESVELHGGTISVESEIGVGTVFTLHIPLVS